MTRPALFAGFDAHWVERPLELAADRLGFTLTPYPGDASAVLCLHEQAASAVAGLTLQRGKPFGQHALCVLRDRIMQAQLGIPLLPTLIPHHPADVHEFFGRFGKIFIKRRMTLTKIDQLSYRSFESEEEFFKIIPADFWAEQASPSSACGEYVIQPYLGHPFRYVDVSVSIGPDGHAWCHGTWRMEDVEPNQVNRMVLVPPITHIENLVQSVADTLELGPGMHCVQFANFNDQWCLLDWNPRIGEPERETLLRHSTFFDPALQHMLGIPVSSKPPQYIECRGFWENPFGLDEDKWLIENGLMPYQWRGVIPRVFVAGDTQDEVNQKFEALDWCRRH